MGNRPNRWQDLGAVTGRFLGVLQSIVRERLGRRRITDVAGLTRFVETRAAYVAQTALYGYLKARMGTSFQRHFEDDAFSRVIRNSAIRLYFSCLADLAVYAAAITGQDGRLGDTECDALARHCFRAALAGGTDHLDDVSVPAEMLAAFDKRAGATIWTAAAQGGAAFTGSITDLLRVAPVIDEFKAEDEEQVTNSMRFRWRNTREQLRNRTDADAVAEDWRRTSVSSGVS